MAGHKSLNKLKIDKQQAVIASLIEGCSIRSTQRMTGIHRATVMRLLVRTGQGSERRMDESMRAWPAAAFKLTKSGLMSAKSNGILRPPMIPSVRAIHGRCGVRCRNQAGALLPGG